MMCLEIARFQNFTPNTPRVLKALSGQTPPLMALRFARCLTRDDDPPLKIPAYGPDYISILSPPPSVVSVLYDKKNKPINTNQNLFFLNKIKHIKYIEKLLKDQFMSFC